MNDLQVTQSNTDIVSSLVIKGDLSGLSQGQKLDYYRAMCERLGLDPMTQPFKLLNLSGKQVLYCDRSGAQQLNKIHKISHERKASEHINDVYVVFMRATLPDGRFTESSGAVTVGSLKGDALANALMKAETKAKRRATLDIVGLGILDESELETIPNARVDAFVPSESFDQRPPEERTTVAPGATVGTFDPMTDIIGFGKNKGMKWIEVPASYLQWLAKEGKSEDKQKAEATLKHKQAVEDQQPDVLDEMFGREPVEAVSTVLDPPQATLIEVLSSELEEMTRKGDIDALEGWGKLNRDRIGKLTEDEQKGLRKSFTAAKKLLKGA